MYKSEDFSSPFRGYIVLIFQTMCKTHGGAYLWRRVAVPAGSILNRPAEFVGGPRHDIVLWDEHSHGLSDDKATKEFHVTGKLRIMKNMILAFKDNLESCEFVLPKGSFEFVAGKWERRRRVKYALVYSTKYELWNYLSP